MVLKFLGLGKKSEYFLEAEPLSSNGAEAPAPEAASTQAKPAKADHVEVAQPAAPVLQAVNSAEVSVPDALEVTANGAAPAAQPKRAKKLKKTAAEKPAAEAEPPAPKAVEPIPEPVSTTFASDYLLPRNTPRRRPGPSLDGFRNLARQVKSK